MPTANQLTDQAWLAEPSTRDLIAAFDRAGIDFRFVGGAVRDGLLGRPVTDIDVATPSPPAAVIRAIEAAGLKAVPTGIDHGTVTAVARGRPFEITTLRRDVETDGRHAVVAFTDDWREDAARRDFTMNALYADRDGRVTDFFGGIADARAGRVRFIGDPTHRIREDALRILRFFRFHAWYGLDGLDPDGLAACAALAGMIDRLSGERVRNELFKLLRASNPTTVWVAMVRAGIVERIIPAATRVDDLARLIAIESGLGLVGDSIRRLAALTGPLEVGDLDRLKVRLKLSNRDAEMLAACIEPAAGVASLTEVQIPRALYATDPASLFNAALIAHARSGRPDAATLSKLRDFSVRWVRPQLPVTGTDIVARGVAPGPTVGAMLSELEAWWTAQDFLPDRNACLAELDQRMRRLR